MTAAAKLAQEIMGPDAEQVQFKLKSGRHSGLRRNFHEREKGQASKFIAKWCRKAHEAGLQLFIGKTQYYLGPGEYTESWGVVSFNPADGPPPDLLDRLPKEFPPTVTPVYALPTLKWLEVLEFARVGTENDWNEDVVKSLFRDRDPKQRTMLVEVVTAMGGLRKFVDEERNSLKITGRTRQQQIVSGLTKLMKIAPFAITLAEPNELKARFVEPLSDEVAYQAARIVFVLSAESYNCHPEEIAQRLVNKELFRLGWRSW